MALLKLIEFLFLLVDLPFAIIQDHEALELHGSLLVDRLQIELSQTSVQRHLDTETAIPVKLDLFAGDNQRRTGEDELPFQKHEVLGLVVAFPRVYERSHRIPRESRHLVCAGFFDRGYRMQRPVLRPPGTWQEHGGRADRKECKERSPRTHKRHLWKPIRCESPRLRSPRRGRRCPAWPRRIFRSRSGGHRTRRRRFRDSRK